MKEVSLFLNGRFYAVVSGPAEFVVLPTLQRWSGDWADGRYDDSWWFDAGETRQRQPCPVQTQGLILSGVLPGSTITIEGQRYECADGGDVELSFQFPGAFEITVSCWPYLDGSYIVENPSQAK